jgi:hypothetical protein
MKNIKEKIKETQIVSFFPTVATIKIGDKVLSHGQRPIPLAHPSIVIKKVLVASSQYEISLQDDEGNIEVIFLESNRPVELEPPF